MNKKWKRSIAGAVAISMLAGYMPVIAAPLNLAQTPLVMPPGGTPQILFAIGNSGSMDGDLSGAIMTGSGSLGASLQNSSSPTNYTIPAGFTPPLNAGSAGQAPYTVSCSGISCDNGPSRLNVAKQAIQTVINNNISNTQFGLMTYSVSPSIYTTWVYYMSPSGGFTFSATPPATGQYVVNPCYNYASASATINSNCTAIATLYPAGTVANNQYMSVGASSDDPSVNDVLYAGGLTGVFVNYSGPNPASPFPPNFSLSQYNNGSVVLGYGSSQPNGYALATGPTNAGFVPYSPQVMYAERGFAYYGVASSTSGSTVVGMTQTAGNFTNSLKPETNSTGTSEIKASGVQSPLAGLLAASKTYLTGLPTGNAACPPNRFVVLVTDGLPTQDLNGKSWPPLGSAAAAGYGVTATFNPDGSLNTTNDQALTDTITTLKALNTAGIKTYIVGLGAGVNATVNPVAAQTLQAMAIAGGTNSYFAATNASALASALQSIVNLSQQSASSVGLNAQQPQQPVNSYTQAYSALFQPKNWWGELKASPFVIGTGNNVSVSAIANWDASCVLTGGTCPATGSVVSATAQSPSAGASGGRQILTWNGGGVAFQWANLSNAEKCGLAGQAATCTLTAALNTKSSIVLDYLRGDRSNEAANGGLLRTRTGVLGDIVNSSPSWVGAPAYSYPLNSWTDQFHPSATMPENAAGAQTYGNYISTNASRLNVVYAGANDGLLHGFEAGSFNSGNYVTASNDGKEVLAYVPSPVYDLIGQTAGYADPIYLHHFYVDATPGSGDLFYAGSWHTWLVGGLGAGGNALYALNVSDPSTFAESNASSLVVKELNTSNIACSNVANCYKDLGNTYGIPIIRRMHNGDWAVIWGNGYNSQNGTAAIFIADINATTGAWTIYELNTGYGTSNDPTGQSRPDGIAEVGSADLDGDHVVDYLYAGDLFGNVWRFDVTDALVANWSVSKFGGGSAAPLFSARDGAGNAQPITTKIIAVSVPSTSGAPKVLLEFGTGKLLELPDQTATSTQTLYGIMDYDMANWDGSSTYQYANFTAPQAISRSKLQQQTVTGTFDSSGNAYTVSSTGPAYRTLSQNPVCWNGTGTCTSPATNNQYGWYLDFPLTGEELIYDPTLISGVLIFNTFVPFSAASCGTINLGFTMGINAATGGALASSFFANGSGSFVTMNGQVVAGIGQGGVGTPNIVMVNGKPYLISQQYNGTPTVNPVQIPPGGFGGRATWVQIR